MNLSLDIYTSNHRVDTDEYLTSHAFEQRKKTTFKPEVFSIAEDLNCFLLSVTFSISVFKLEKIFYIADFEIASLDTIDL
jgi:hypothetical protein